MRRMGHGICKCIPVPCGCMAQVEHHTPQCFCGCWSRIRLQGRHPAVTVVICLLNCLVVCDVAHSAECPYSTVLSVVSCVGGGRVLSGRGACPCSSWVCDPCTRVDRASPNAPPVPHHPLVCPSFCCGFTGLRYRYNWKEEEARKNILRTHTTAVSARMLYEVANVRVNALSPALSAALPAVNHCLGCFLPCLLPFPSLPF